MPVSKDKLFSWKVGNPIYSEVSQTHVFSWKMGNRPSRGLFLSWETGQVQAFLQIGWKTESASPNVGTRRTIFITRHTGEPGSEQVIRFRDASDPSKILYESDLEDNPLDTMMVMANWASDVIQDAIVLNQTFERDWGLNFTEQNALRPSSVISSIQLPAYVTQEYKSSTDFKHIIRYLGYMSKNPLIHERARVHPSTIEQIMSEHNLILYPANLSGRDLNIRVRVSDGTIITGILPSRAAFAIRKISDDTIKVGYAKPEGMRVLPGPGIEVSPDWFDRYFIPY